MIISANNVTINLSEAEVCQFGAIISDTRPAAITRAATQALHHVLGVCSSGASGSPVMLDAHVFVAQKMLLDEGAPLDRDCIQMLLKAWNKAECSLQPDARKALRLVAPLSSMVLSAADKKAFRRQFDAGVLPRLDSTQGKTAGFLRTYIEALQAWLEEQAPTPGQGAHYLENMVYYVYTTIVCAMVEDKGKPFVHKRLSAAKDALDSYLFD